ncbi:MAG: 16S rRNA (cytosine(1402)-N(4))-methyltransferase RsmH [Bauldia sp.]|nr:16S rRNA (cytosine(1402)-N(4))-methyltransferase RsmH [Bauldia sp.]
MTGRDSIGIAGGPAGHVPVLLDEVLDALRPQAGQTIIDGTFGAGGYTSAILARGARVIAIDRDPAAIAGGRALVAGAAGRLTLAEGRFSEMDAIAREAGYEAVDGVVLDIGVSSMQLDQAERGFSFMRDGPLDMRMGRDGPTAADVVNSAEPKALTRIIGILGEEKKATLVSRAIVRAREEKPLSRTAELAALIERAIGRRPTDPIHPATRTFQALRIYVNGELDELADALAAAERILTVGGRLAVVTFHSLEDRIAKLFLADRSRERAGGSRHAPEAIVPPATFTLLGKGVRAPGGAEIAANPRARSAKLRAAIRTSAPARPLDPAAFGVPNLSLNGARA